MRKNSLHIAVFLFFILLSPIVFQSFHTFSHHHHELFDANYSHKNLLANEITKNDDCIILEFKYVTKDLPVESAFAFQLVFQLIDFSTLPTRIWIYKKVETSANRGPPNKYLFS